MFKEKMKKFWNEHKGLVITAGVGIGAGLCYLAFSKNSVNAVDDLVDSEVKALEAEFDTVFKGELEKVNNIPDDCCLVDGELKPIFVDDEGLQIYDYAFENDQVKEEFREMGYTIVESK